ncbi:hypothetical protein [Halomonas mongoliensis]|uniref:hypothetical protein n=1 Tax=Halomonas mongoliensis TaxID=321265 RepID=UPI00403A8393
MKFLKKQAIKVLKARGFYRVQDLPPLDFRGLELHPVQLARVLGDQEFLVDVPVNRLRAFDFIGFCLERGGRHPFVKVAEEILADKVVGFASSTLEAYYVRVQPQSFSDVLFDCEGLQLAGDGFTGLSSLEASFPWLRNDPKKVRRSRLREMDKEARQHGKRGTEYLFWPFVGPVSLERGELEFQRLKGFLDSVAERGYQPHAHEGHVGGYLLTRGDEYAVVISGGQHRAACLSALGYERIPVVIKNAQGVAREDAACWGGVRSGFFSREQALNIFDRVLEGRLPYYFETSWPSKVT